MVDTIKIQLMIDDIGNIPNIPTVYKSPNGAYKGKLKNIIVRCFPSGTSYYVVLQGSLHTYLYGNNIVDFNYVDLNKAILNMIDDLGIDITHGTVKRLDVGKNIKVKKSPSLYNLCLVLAKGFKRQPYDDGSLYFTRATKQLYFYNKFAEAKRKGQWKIVASTFQSRNVLRYELRLNHLQSKALSLNKKNLLVSDLLNHKIYKRLIKLWFTEYQLITKKAKKSPVLDRYSDFKAFIQDKGIMAFGLNTCFILLEEWCLLKGVSSQKKSNIKKWLKNANPKQQSGLISELDRKIKKVKMAEIKSLSSIQSGKI